jgi:hypothetical protein
MSGIPLATVLSRRSTHAMEGEMRKTALVVITMVLLSTACDVAGPDSDGGSLDGAWHLITLNGEDIPYRYAEPGCEINGTWPDDAILEAELQAFVITFQPAGTFSWRISGRERCNPPGGIGTWEHYDEEIYPLWYQWDGTSVFFYISLDPHPWFGETTGYGTPLWTGYFKGSRMFIDTFFLADEDDPEMTEDMQIEAVFERR